MTKDKKRRRRRRSSLLYTPIALLLIAIIGIFGVSVFFRVATIEVTGAEKYTVQQILSGSGLKTGDNIFFIDADKVSRRIRSNLPYLSEVVVEKEMPDTVRITVSESRPLAVVRYESDWWIIDQMGRVLEATDNLGAAEKIKVSGLTIASLGVGETLGVGEEEQTKFQYLTEVLRAVQSAGIAGGVQTLDVSNIANITFDYIGRFTVTFGSGEDADNKIVRVLKAIETLKDTDRGRIDVSDEEDWRYIPESAV